MLVARVLLLLLITSGFAHAETVCTFWQIRSPNADPLFRFVKNGKYGFIDNAGKVVIEPTLTGLGNCGGEFHEGLLSLENSYVDASGKTIISGVSGSDFSEGLALVSKREKKEPGFKAGFVDRSGSWVVEPQFAVGLEDRVESFSDGRALVQTKGMVGYIERSGTYAIAPVFVFGRPFREGKAKVVVEGPCRYSSAEREDPWDDFWSESVVAPAGYGGWNLRGEDLPRCLFSFIDTRGELVSTRTFDGARDFSGGMAAVKVGDKWGFIDQSGGMAIQPRFSHVLPFSDGVAVVEDADSNNRIVIDKAGNVVLQRRSPGDVIPSSSYSEGLARVHDKGGVWFIDKKGERAFSGTFIQASHFFHGLAHVKLEESPKAKPGESNRRFWGTGRFAYIDKSGEVVLEYVVDPDD